jgi:ATP-dependent RNA helicase SUPV3L1/SUV3
MLEGSSITAVLGPTNTGKTHRAVERMLSYDTGMIGLPLRLLAREVYDRITAKVGEARVALITGEEKRVPKNPAYWVCTVEAMPTDRDVDFVAVDEIQLAATEQRGHVFTERLLSARGRRETWFLGSRTIEPALAELVPSARVVSHPRLSRLSFRGMDRLGKLPPRSALVGFSATQVFELGERLRASRGGAAIVMGALSPRTRNAQVAMFQAGEVDYLVATDAVGMGLNLHVSHVAFASLRKFDGQRVRDLEATELAQIAGRAGRYVADGTFGTLDPIFLADDVAQAIEAHRFAPVRRPYWRSDDLDFSSIERLRESLRQRPRSRWLRLVDDAEDAAALAHVAGDERVRGLARGETAVRLLWEVCRIPDFRKLLPETHAAFVAEVFVELAAPRGRLSDDWMEARVRTIDDVSGEVETLTDRLAKIRTMTFLASHARWVLHPEAWRERTRSVEDRLSDALHDRLVQRFVERGGKRRLKTSLPGKRPMPTVVEDTPVDAAHPFARLAALRSTVARAPEPPPEVGADAWIEGLVAAPAGAFSLDVTGRIAWGERPVARLRQGAKLGLPEIRLLALDELAAGARARVLRRLSAAARDLVDELFAPWQAAKAGLAPSARGVVYQVEQGLGAALTDASSIGALGDVDREALAAIGIVVGRLATYAPRLLVAAAIDRRVALATAYFPRAVRRPPPGATSLAIEGGVSAGAYLAIGFLPMGSRAVRVDVAERVAEAVASGGGDARAFGHWMGCSPRVAERVASFLTEPPSESA